MIFSIIYWAVLKGEGNSLILKAKLWETASNFFFK